MPLNLISDRWIPAIRDGGRITLRPDEIAREGVVRLDWTRGDLNLACLELLIGLVFLADPPCHDADWHERYETPDPGRLRGALKPFTPHFDLTGDGPRFLQDMEQFEVGAKPSAIKPPDMLFIDGAGELTKKKNADLTVKRDRYTILPLPLAAMALYAFQAFAPQGGAGNRTSMRGGGPLVTLVQPIDGGAHALWRMVWCNVPEGAPLPADRASEALPWLRKTRTSSRDEIATPAMSHSAEAFFGMPRRLRLRFMANRMTGVVQKKHGTKYDGWQHPLSPYYRKNAGDKLLAKRTQPGKVSYRNWLGLTFGESNETRVVATAVHRFNSLYNPPAAEVFAGGWATKNMQARDFSLHVYPTFPSDQNTELLVGALVEAANAAASTLKRLLRTSVGMKGNAVETVSETFFTTTESDFVNATKAAPTPNGTEVEEQWLNTLRRTTLELFDLHAVPSLVDRSAADIEKIVNARKKLLAAFTTGPIRRALKLDAKVTETGK